jgi:hypothetical protein
MIWPNKSLHWTSYSARDAVRPKGLRGSRTRHNGAGFMRKVIYG